MTTTGAGRRGDPLATALTPTHPYRRVLAAGEAAIGGAAVAGSALLVAGAFAPDIAVLAPLHLHSWVLPGAWLFASVAVPSGVASWAAYRRSPGAPIAVIVSSALLMVELAVQLPFLGPHPLQVVMGLPGVALAALAVRARGRGWR